MNAMFKEIGIYRIMRQIPMVTLASDIGLSLNTVRQTLLGITKPHDYNMPLFERFYNAHRAEIEEAVSEFQQLKQGAGVPTGSLS